MLVGRIVIWLLGNKHPYVMPKTYLVQLIKSQFFDDLVSYCNSVYDVLGHFS